MTLLVSTGLLLAACTEDSQVESVDTEEDTEEVSEDTQETNGVEETVEEDVSEDTEEVDSEDTEDEIISDGDTIGDTIQFDGLHITLNSVHTSDGSDWETPDNDHYLVVDLTIENTTDEEANISTMLQMSVQDDELYTHNIALYTETEGSLDGELGAGRSTRGQVAFDVPNSDNYEFIFEHPFTNGQAIWEFDLSE